MNIFVFTAGNKPAQEHLNDTVKRSVNEELLKEFLSEDDFSNLKEASRGEGFYCWGAIPGLNNKKNWDKIVTGDKILSYWDLHYHHVSTIIYKTRNTELAKRLWGTLKNETWEYMYFFKKPFEFEISQLVTTTADYLQGKYMGFAKIRDDKVLRIISEYGSLENLFEIGSNSVTETNYNYKKQNNTENMNILTAIKTKPFILLAGISGTGKSRLVRTLAFKTCNHKDLNKDDKKPGNFELIPVRPNWHDSTELMGYVSRINGERYITTTFLRFIGKAWHYPNVPFFLCLDEMNLAPVEHYFAEYLSIIETRQSNEGNIVTDHLISKASFKNEKLYEQILDDLGLKPEGFPNGISIPPNLIVMGTVNMDETTCSFSRKVLDRAMTIEMNEVDLKARLDLNENDWSYPREGNFISSDKVIGTFTSGAEVYNQEDFAEKDKIIGFLEELNGVLNGTPFKIAYRVRDEFLVYSYHASQNSSGNWLNPALDEMTSMKVLSRIEGDENKTSEVLKSLHGILNADNFQKSNAKLTEMIKRLETSGYTSYWT